MSEYAAINHTGRMIAPKYMQPRKPVLDEPLDIDRGRQTIAMPTRQAAAPTPEPVRVQVEAVPAPVTEPVLTVEAPARDTVYYAELVGEQSVAEQPAQFVAEPVAAAEPESEPAPERKRRKMTKFQQLIIFLLEVVVVLVLATVYLYITGRIDLPPVVMEVIEKGLSLIP